MPKPKRIRAATRRNMSLALVAIPNADLRKLGKLSRRTGLTRSELVRRAVSKYLESYDGSR